MKYFIILVLNIILIGGGLSPLNAADNHTTHQLVQDIANSIAISIKQNEPETFITYHHRPDDISWISSPDAYVTNTIYLAYIFDKTDTQSPAYFFKQDQFEISIELLYYKEHWPEAIITYYNPNKFDPNQEYTAEWFDEHWAQDFIQTRLTLYKDQWGILTYGFYYAQHVPWAGEYGR